jgi:erythromycin esterase
LLVASLSCVGLDQVAIDWIATHATPLDSLEPGTGLADLQPLRESLASARVVAIGEGTHGTREFFTLRHRLMELLAMNLSFRAFAFEFPYGEGVLIDRYVRTGEGDPADVLRRVYCTPWNHQEMLDTIEWMHTYNEGRVATAQIGFHGIDIHDGDSGLLIDSLLTFIERVAPDKRETYAARFDAFRYPSMYHAVLFIDSDGTVREGLRWVVEDLESNASSYEDPLGETAYDVALHEAELLLQRAEMYALSAVDSTAGSLLRDESMAENVLWLLNTLGSGTKIAFSGHNYHVGRFANLSTTIGGQPVQLTSAGWHLGRWMGSSYVVLGTTTKNGDVAIFPFPGGERDQVAVMSIPRVGYDGHATLLHAAGIPNFILDLRAPDGEPGTEWMFDSDPFLHIGTTFYTGIKDSFRIYTPLRPVFDLIAYIETTSAPTMFEWVPKDDLQ